MTTQGGAVRHNGGLATTVRHRPEGEHLLRGGVDVCGYRPPSPNASPTAMIPAVSAKAKLKITSAAPASM